MILTKNETSLKQFGLRLRSAREKQRLTQEDLVERLGKKTPTAISEYESGKRRLYAYELKDYADALEVPVTYFFYGQLQTDDEMEQALIEWFRHQPKNRRPRVFKLLEALETLEPLILGATDDKPKKKG